MTESSHHIVHLGYGKDAKKPLPGFSQRRVRFRVLTQQETSQIRDQAFRAADKEAQMFTVLDNIANECVAAMIVSWTEPTKPDGPAFGNWIQRSGDLVPVMGDLFTVKDRDMLRKLYEMWHTVNPAEINDIMGGIVGVVD